MARTSTEFPPALYASIQHPPFAVELSAGCSIGCWFCGVDAGRFNGFWPFTPENARYWEEILEVLSEFSGATASRRGFLYWATDPLDNPDYEFFADVFRDKYGLFPHTTTAQPLRHVNRIRSMLKYCSADEPFMLRFSVLTKAMLARIHKEFSADELAFVELIPQMKGSIVNIVPAGKVRNANVALNRTNILPFAEAGTISCVSGFVINMVASSVKLISPCQTSAKWPNGHYIYEECTFHSARHLHTIISRMVNKYMSPSYFKDKIARFRDDLRYEVSEHSFALSGEGGSISFDGGPHIRELGELLRSGTRTLEDIVVWFDRSKGFGPRFTNSWLSEIVESGVLNEEPPPPIGSS